MLTIRYLDGLILALHNCACRNGLLWKQSIAFFDAVLPQLLSTRGYVESLYRIHVGRKSLYSLSYYTIDGTFVCLHWRCWRALRVTDWFRTTWIKMQRAYYPWCMNVKLRCLVFQYHTLRISVCGSESITFTQSGTYRLRLLSLLVKGVREQSLFFNAFMLISAESSVVRVVMNYDSDKIQCEAWRSNARGSLISYGHTSFAFPMYFNSRRHTIQQC